MGEKCPHRKVTKRRDSNKQSLRTKFQLKADDAVYDALQKPDAEIKAFPMDGDLPGMGQYYCLHCNRYFENVKVRDEHLKPSDTRSEMVTGNNHREDGERNPASVSRVGGVSRSWGTTISGQSVSTSGSVGSPSSRSEQATATPASDSTFLRLNHLDIPGDDAGSQGGNAKKKKRRQLATGADKSGSGLRQFSMRVFQKVESKGRTTYNEVADELVAEFADIGNAGVASPDQQQHYEKNIRRRVYDALNVLAATDIISKDQNKDKNKDKKEIQWKGRPRTSLSDIEELKAERVDLRGRTEKKAAYLQELEEQYIGLQNLIQRNEHLYSSGNVPNGGVALPFILVQTRPHATVEVEISEDMQLVHFDFNSTPFELHDDNYVLKAMKFCDRSESDDVGNNVS